MAGLESMQGMQREFQTICLMVTKLHADKHRYKQGASEVSPPTCNK